VGDEVDALDTEAAVVADRMRAELRRVAAVRM